MQTQSELYLDAIQNSVRKASRFMARDFGELENLQSTPKNISKFISVALSRVERVFNEELESFNETHDIEFLGRIQNQSVLENGEKPYRFMINLCDGLVNFIHALPSFTITITLQKKLEKSYEDIVTAIACPAFNTIYFAEKNAGCYLENDNSSGMVKIRVGSRKDFDGCMVISSQQVFFQPVLNKLLVNLVKKRANLRCLGSYNYGFCLLASGNADIYLLENSKPLESSPGFLLAKEAGALVRNETHQPALKDDRIIVSANEAFSKNLAKL